MTAQSLEHEWDRRSVDFPLTAASLVWEVGGYEGRWASAIHALYAPRLYVFEPQRWAFEKLRARLESAPNVRLFNFGLGDRDARDLPMRAFGTDGASFLAPPGDVPDATGDMREAGRLYREMGEPAIDLILVNVEGYEYTLIPYLARVGIFPRWLLYQSHPRPGDEAADIALRVGLINSGYGLLWDYGHVLSAWVHRSGPDG